MGKPLGGACPPEFFPKFLTLPQIIPTSLAKQKGNTLYKNSRITAVLVLPPAVKKNGKTKSETDVFSMKFDRTDLIIGQSKAKNCEESVGDVRIGVAPQKPSKNMEKPEKSHNKTFFAIEK